MWLCRKRSGRHRWILSVLAVTFLWGGCRPEPGEPDYASQEEFSLDNSEADEILPGPDPYVPGVARLSVGVFYEGGASQVFTVDEMSRHFYIYATEGADVPTFSQASTGERVEGLRADRVVHGGQPWWGGGVHWDLAQDLSSWRMMHLSLRSEDSAFASVQIAMESNAAAGVVQAEDYGYIADGDWHHIAIPLDDFAASGVLLGAVTIPLRLGGGRGSEGEVLLVDNVYFSQ